VTFATISTSLIIIQKISGRDTLRKWNEDNRERLNELKKKRNQRPDVKAKNHAYKTSEHGRKLHREYMKRYRQRKAVKEKNAEYDRKYRDSFRGHKQ